MNDKNSTVVTDLVNIEELEQKIAPSGSAALDE